MARKSQGSTSRRALMFSSACVLFYCSISTNAQTEVNICISFTAAHQCKQFPQSCLWSNAACYAIPCQVFTSQSLCANKGDGLNCAWQSSNDTCVFVASSALLAAVQILFTQQRKPTQPGTSQTPLVTTNPVDETLYNRWVPVRVTKTIRAHRYVQHIMLCCKISANWLNFSFNNSCWLYTTESDCTSTANSRINDEVCMWTENRCYPADLFNGDGSPSVQQNDLPFQTDRG